MCLIGYCPRRHTARRGARGNGGEEGQGRRASSPARCISCSAAPATLPASSIRRRRRTSTATGPTPNFRKTPIHGSRRRARHEGSWWNDWQAWIDENNGGVKVAARVPGDGKLEVIEDAPSAYVSLRLEAKKKHKTGSGERNGADAICAMQARSLRLRQVLPASP